MSNDLTRPIIGIENRTAEEVFDIMADRIRYARPSPAAGVEILSPEDAWQDLLDKDDRTSPEEYPDMALITLDELRDYMTAGLPTLPDGDPDRTACDGPAGGGVFAHPALRAAQVRGSGS